MLKTAQFAPRLKALFRDDPYQPRLLAGVVLAISRNQYALKLLHTLYRLQLWIAVRLLAAMPDTQLIVLRRKNSLHELFPGNSDYDLTCIVSCNSAMQKMALYHRLYRVLHTVLPVIRDLHLIEHTDWPAVQHSFFFDYGDPKSPALLYHKKRFILPPLRSELPYPFIRWRMAELFLGAFWQQYAGLVPIRRKSQTYHSIGAKKLRAKTTWLRQMLDSRSSTHLRYSDHFCASEDAYLTATERKELLQASYQILCESIAPGKITEEMSVRYVGNPTPPDQELVEKLSATWNESNYLPPRATTEFFLVDTFLYHTGKLAVFIAEEPNDILPDTQFRTLQQETFKLLGRSEVSMETPVPILVDAKTFSALQQVNPILKALSSKSRHCLQSNQFYLNPVEHINVSVDYCRLMALETIINLYSMPRKECSAYYCDVVFGQLLVFRTLFESGVLCCQPELLVDYIPALHRLSGASLQIFHRYLRGDLNALAQIPTRTVFKAFERLIESELPVLRAACRFDISSPRAA